MCIRDCFHDTEAQATLDCFHDTEAQATLTFSSTSITSIVLCTATARDMYRIAADSEFAILEVEYLWLN